MTKKIGFHLEQNDPTVDKKPSSSDNPLSDILGASKSKTIEMISMLYSPTGLPESSEFVTSTDIICKLEDIIHISKSTLSAVLTELGFAIKFLDGSPFWKVFLKQPDDDY